MKNFNVVVIGGSAGSVENIVKICSELPANLPAAVLVVTHIPATTPSILSDIIGRRSAMNVGPAQDGEALKPGRIYVAPTDHHLVVERNRVGVARGPRENGHRPAIDPLFRTAATVYGPGVIGVVLSGNLDDGSAGLREIVARGGIAIVENPEEALYRGMPDAAAKAVPSARIVNASRIAAEIVNAVALSGTQPPEDPEPDTAAGGQAAMLEDERELGRPSAFGCPDCGGVLWELDSAGGMRHRCRVGHAFSQEALYAAQNEGLERALWTALRALEEMSNHARNLSTRMAARGNNRLQERFRLRAEDADERAAVVRSALMKPAHVEDSHMAGDDD